MGRELLRPIIVPDSAANIVAIAAGGDNSLALLADGTVVGWGGITSVRPRRLVGDQRYGA